VWLTDSARRRAIVIALNLVPFAGIAFLWFIGVVRDRIGQREDRFFASVFLGSGLLFVAMLFAAAAFAGGLIANAAAGSAAPGPDTLRTKVVPRWIGLLGFAVAVVLLISVGLTAWVELLFPAWILLLSVDILRTGLRQSPGAAEVGIGAQA
jgi:hypothetical protein